jgi:anti-sigma regulatory factor (Ser/Thr protein kinase)
MTIPLDAAFEALRLECSPSELRRASLWLLERCQQEQICQADAFRIDLCANELLQNLISYACSDPPENFMELGLTLQPGEALLTLRDSGAPFDPRLAAPPADRPDDPQIGGFGIALVRRFSDGLEYERQGQENLVRVHFTLKTPPAAA